MWLLSIFSVVVLVCQVQGQTLCAVKFSRYNVNHTACLPPRSVSHRPTNEGVTLDKRRYIVRLHNYYRSTVHRHSNQPAATNMQKMYWDDELAMIAQKWASNCIGEHDGSAKRSVPGKYPVGQNLGRGHRGWSTVLRQWHSEVRGLSFGGERGSQSSVIGHYTQMVWANSARIGCGYARCNRTKPFYVCNYAPSGNKAKSMYTPYTAGVKTAACPGTSTPGLCDCEGKVCYNGGTLNLQTCQCTCLDKPWIRQDSVCSLDCSRAEDSFACASNGGRWDLEACGKYVNVPFEYCPLTCNLCPAQPLLPDTTAAPVVVTTPTIFFLNLPTTAAVDHVQPATQVIPADLNYSPLINHQQRMTPGIRFDPTAAAITSPPTSTTAPSSTTAATPTAASAGLPSCSTRSEIAKCGQPNSRGYYNPKYCQFGLDYYCPAMCGTCTVSSCIDYEGREYPVGNSWMNEYGEMTCTANGVKVRRGCYVEKSGTVISELEEHSYTDRNISWLCVCNEGYSLSCQGVWSPSGKVRH